MIGLTFYFQYANKHKKYANLHIERNGDKRWKFHRRTEKKQLKK